LTAAPQPASRAFLSDPELLASGCTAENNIPVGNFILPRTNSSPAPGHCFRKVTLTKPTFCHSCSDFIWGLVGFLCEVCNFMCHEKCLKTLRTVCSSAAFLLLLGVFLSNPDTKVCCPDQNQDLVFNIVCVSVCELHVHADCAAFTCADCRSSHLDGTLEQDTSQHHWREGNLASAARCEVCRRSCGSSDVLAGMRCEWCSITVRTSQSQRSLPHRGSDALSRSRHTCVCVYLLGLTGKQFLKVFDGDDAVKRGFFRLVSICRATRNEEVVVKDKRCSIFTTNRCKVMTNVVVPQVSLRQMNQTRFYAVQNQNRTVQVNLLIGGLPPLLAKEEYSSCELPCVYCVCVRSGAVALLISCFAEAERIYMLAKDTSVSNKPLTSLVIPEILHDQLGADVCPLLVFVNPKSGGLKGRELLYSFRKLLNPHQVFDISNGGPLKVLHLVSDHPVMAVLDLYMCVETLIHDCVCYLNMMDNSIVQMNNYFGIGIDAELSLDFHLAREDEPDKFTSRFHNKGVYVKVGLQKISHTRSLHKELQLQVDAQNVALPNIEGLIFLNIPSWGSGADLWGSEGDGRFGKPSIDDGLLEVVGVTGVVHMGQVQSGLRSGIRIAQGNYIRLTVSKPIPVQVDGEPWIQPPGHIIISAAGPKVRMLRKSKQKQKKSSANVRNGCSESPSSRDEGH
uniref:diacylglycerol kinase (ATP) n=1 Tax=Stegastes partitus TaxID=144197 RepID=A0A3B5BIV4_9TELE